ncbi:cytochrome-c peroxidase [Burkholderiaceae bacterium DAT-1]|nr:cytochrome-c peroxidase [Burkholderiaceae bacterium DAT-1]
MNHPHSFKMFAALLAVAALPVLAAFYQQPRSGVPQAAITRLGEALFFDPRLSASGQQSCASCHDPAHHFAPANALAIQPGGADGLQLGNRAVPSLKYRAGTPPFSEHFYEGEGSGIDQGPTGGLTWDGRADSLHEQARLPLLSPVEMANKSDADVVEKIRQAGYLPRYQAIFGEAIAHDDTRIMNATLQALEAFQQSPALFYPFSSKYDAYLRGHTALSKLEAEGLRLFDDPQKGNCASCHPSTIRDGGFPVFSDWGHIALGVPRNGTLRVNLDADYFDLGLCGPARRDLATRSDTCGLFKTPSLRNVATRKVFFHNGVMHDLHDAVAFYATRDTHPQRWYPVNASGVVHLYDDLPIQYHDNLNRDAPFGGKPGDAPVLNDADIAAIVAFLGTLTDGYAPQISAH